MRTVVVNLFAGPGAGKTTCAWEIASKLKKHNINTEYVSEYAKELVWAENYEKLADQRHIFETQSNRIERLLGKVEVIVTDSPIIFSMIYGKNNTEEFNQEIVDKFKGCCNFNLFINRGEGYEQAGRLQTRDESVAIDNQIKDLLEQQKIYYGTYYHNTIDLVVDNIQTTLSRVQWADEVEARNAANETEEESEWDEDLEL